MVAKIALLSFLCFATVLLLVDGIGLYTSPFKRTVGEIVRVRVTDGPSAGREGNVVSGPHILNLWHRYVTINVPATREEALANYPGLYDGHEDVLDDELSREQGPRHWLTVWHGQLEQIDDVP